MILLTYSRRDKPEDRLPGSNNFYDQYKWFDTFRVPAFDVSGFVRLYQGHRLAADLLFHIVCNGLISQIERRPLLAGSTAESEHVHQKARLQTGFFTRTMPARAPWMVPLGFRAEVCQFPDNPGGEMIPIEIRSKAACADDDICRFAERRMRFALDRFRNLRRLILSLEDVNGPKGGPDKHCRIVAVFGFTTVVVEELRSNWKSSVALAIRRVARNAARELEKVNRSPLHAAHRTAFKSKRFRGDAPETA